MEITSEEMQELLYNPYNIQKKILEELETSEGVKISNANNPFTLLLESAVTIGHANTVECKNIIRKKFPVLAKSIGDLYDHLDEDDINNLFAKPGSVDLKFYIPVIAIKNKGYKPAGAQYREARIPYKTTITVLGKVFTILNTIIIRSYETTELPYVEIVPNDDPLSITNITVVESKIESDKNQQPYITFTIPVKQLTIGTVEKTLSASSRSKFKLSLTSKFIKLLATCKGNATGSTEVDIPVYLNGEYLNPTTPCAILSLEDSVVNVDIPSMYVVNNLISGTASFTVYETEGDLFLPLEKYSEDSFKVKFGPITHEAEQVLLDANVLVKSKGTLKGGSNGVSFDDVKKSVIYKTTGSISMPVTNYQIEKVGYDSGYTITKVEDTLLNRVFTASKDIPSFTSTVIQCIPDTFNNTVGIILNNLKSDYPTWVRDEDFVIKSGTVFRDDNGIMTMLSPSQKADLDNMSRNAKVTHFKENKYFFNFFTYAVKVKDGVTECKIYHLDFPSFTGLRHRATNQNVANTNCYIDKFLITRTDNGYKIAISVQGSDGYTNEIEQDKKCVQLSLDLNTGSKVHFLGEYDSSLEAYIFNLETDEFVNTDGYLELLNGISETPTKFTPLEGTASVYCYIKDIKKLDKSNYLRDYIVDDDPNVSVLTYDTLDLYFGKEINYLWNKVYHTYTDRKYKTYGEDKQKVYESNVYATDNDGKLVIEVAPSGQEVTLNKLHNKGDLVEDGQGNPIYEYRKGDTVLDESGNPVIDVMSGVVRYLDILMLEYEFRAASASAHTQLDKLIVSYLENTLLTELPAINKNLLEQTKIMFRSERNTDPVTIKANSTTHNVLHRVSPTITLYIDSSLDVKLSDLDGYKFKIGSIINTELKKTTISVPNIVTNIMNQLVLDIKAVKITGLLPNDAQVASVESNNKLVLDKCLNVAEYKETIVVYNIDLVIEKVNA